jgi:hypothetical protein
MTGLYIGNLSGGKTMNIYIASSWKNQHAVQMLTELLRSKGHTVLSFVENNFGEGHGPIKSIPFEEWVLTAKADQSFRYDTECITKSHIVVYIGPSGTDAWAEVGAAWASNVPIIGLLAKGEKIGLMRKMVIWVDDFRDLLKLITDINHEKEKLH